MLDNTVNCSLDGGLSGTDAGGKLKEAGTAHWNSPNTGATDESEFTALPGGYLFSDYVFYYVGTTGMIWTSTYKDSTHSYGRYLKHDSSQIGRAGGYYKTDGLAVRCLKN